MRSTTVAYTSPSHRGLFCIRIAILLAACIISHTVHDGIYIFTFPADERERDRESAGGHIARGKNCSSRWFVTRIRSRVLKFLRKYFSLEKRATRGGSHVSATSEMSGGRRYRAKPRVALGTTRGALSR